ncbi:MAG: aminodeoxychorismate synthase component I [Candidatus Berkiella sp.]
MKYPLVEELTITDPLAIFARVPREGALWLDSAATSKQGQYSFIAFSPFQMIISKDDPVNPWDTLTTLFNCYPLDPIAELPPFQGGIAGVFGYGLGEYLEQLPRSKIDNLAFPDLMVGCYDLVIAIDHQASRSWLFSSGLPELNEDQRLIQAKNRMEYAKALLATPVFLAPVSTATVPDQAIHSPFTQASYEETVERVIEYIRAGDIFEANVSQCFSCELPQNLTAFDLYRRLRQYNPAPFAAYMQVGEFAIASASPERFLQLQAGRVETRPIKGTRPRHANPQQDTAYAKELHESEKDWAENVMIVDLMRNDLSRVCLAHSIKVTQLCKVESFATVHHLVSAVEGQLCPQLNAIDLLKATFPGGSITGAPKIRAMEIIAECEPTVRGPYCGSIGYLGFNGCTDLSITIRTFAIKGTELTFQTGGAVTIDSVPTEEFEETLAKAKALRRTLTTAPL